MSAANTTTILNSFVNSINLSEYLYNPEYSNVINPFVIDKPTVAYPTAKTKLQVYTNNTIALGQTLRFHIPPSTGLLGKVYIAMSLSALTGTLVDGVTPTTDVAYVDGVGFRALNNIVLDYNGKLFELKNGGHDLRIMYEQSVNQEADEVIRNFVGLEKSRGTLAGGRVKTAQSTSNYIVPLQMLQFHSLSHSLRTQALTLPLTLEITTNTLANMVDKKNSTDILSGSLLSMYLICEYYDMDDAQMAALRLQTIDRPMSDGKIEGGIVYRSVGVESLFDTASASATSHDVDLSGMNEFSSFMKFAVIKQSKDTGNTPFDYNNDLVDYFEIWGNNQLLFHSFSNDFNRLEKMDFNLRNTKEDTELFFLAPFALAHNQQHVLSGVNLRTIQGLRLRVYFKAALAEATNIYVLNVYPNLIEHRNNNLRRIILG